MAAAPRFDVVAPVAARARYLVTAYADLVADTARLAHVIDRLRPAHSADQIAAWHAMINAAAYQDLAASLMAEHYDPRYTRHRARLNHNAKPFAVNDLDTASLDALADRLAQHQAIRPHQR